MKNAATKVPAQKLELGRRYGRNSVAVYSRTDLRPGVKLYGWSIIRPGSANEQPHETGTYYGGVYETAEDALRAGRWVNKGGSVDTVPAASEESEE